MAKKARKSSGVPNNNYYKGEYVGVAKNKEAVARQAQKITANNPTIIVDDKPKKVSFRTAYNTIKDTNLSPVHMKRITPKMPRLK